MGKKLILLFSVAILFTSCERLLPSYRVFKGNYLTGRGEYQHAEIEYLKAEQMSKKSPYIQYNLGNLYYSLGEPESALNSWDMAEGSLSSENLVFKLHYNRGILYFNKGEYQRAFDEFKSALKIQPSDIDTKINLELSMEKIGGEKGKAENPGNGTAENADDLDRLLYYIEKKEQKKWSGKFRDQTRSQNDW